MKPCFWESWLLTNPDVLKIYFWFPSWTNFQCIDSPGTNKSLTCDQTNEEQADAPKENVVVEGDLLIDHEPVDNMEEKSNADGTAPEPPNSD